jgi:hypothetical protein
MAQGKVIQFNELHKNLRGWNLPNPNIVFNERFDTCIIKVAFVVTFKLRSQNLLAKVRLVNFLRIFLLL